MAGPGGATPLTARPVVAGGPANRVPGPARSEDNGSSKASAGHAAGAPLGVVGGIIFFSPTKFTFSPTSSLFRQVGSLFRQVGSLIRQALRLQVSGSPLESRRSDRTSSYRMVKLKLLSLSAQLDTCRSEQLRYVFSHPFQVADRRSCNGWHGRAARQSRDRIPASD